MWNIIQFTKIAALHSIYGVGGACQGVLITASLGRQERLSVPMSAHWIVLSGNVL